jgi:uncharacterized OB-fold protein
MTGTSRSYLPEGLPAPTWGPDELEKPFWTGLQEERILVQRCRDCQTWIFGPEWICYSCRSFALEWVDVEGTATIYSWMRVWHPAHPLLKGHVPYLVVVVELPRAGDIRMIGNLLGDPARPAPIGATVRAVFEHHRTAEPAYSLLQWRLDD